MAWAVTTACIRWRNASSRHGADAMHDTSRRGFRAAGPGCRPADLLHHRVMKKSSREAPPRSTETMPAPAASSAQRILDAAEAIFAHEGYFAATIRGITAAAGVPLQLARYHFGSKDQLFQHVL